MMPTTNLLGRAAILGSLALAAGPGLRQPQ
jgi:hypothetical protein